MRGRSNTERRPLGALAALGVGATLAVLIATGCRPDPPEIREARRVAKDFATAIRLHDAAKLRDIASCVVATDGIQDAHVRYLDPPQFIRPAGLDSLILLYAEAQRLADSSYSAAPDAAADLEARFERARSLARRAAATRAARRAVDASRGGQTSGAQMEVKSIRAHLLVKFAGGAVGPVPVERDTIVRLLHTPGGSWIVYAFDLASDAPGPLPY